MRLKGKTALVTGGGSGIGAAIAGRSSPKAPRSVSPGAAERNSISRLRPTPGVGVTLAGDVSSDDDVRRMVAATVALADGVDIFVNNAAPDVFGRIAELDPDDWQRVLDINLTGPFLLMKEAIPHMVRKGSGTIINVASVGGLRCMPGSPAYATSKAGLIFLTQQAALDYGPFGVRCNAVCPGATRTTMLEEAVSGIAKETEADLDSVLARLSSCIPLRRVAAPSEMGTVCAFLASDESSFMTGAVLVVDGGATIVDVAGASLG